MSYCVLFCDLFYGHNALCTSTRLNKGWLQKYWRKITKWDHSTWQGMAVFSSAVEEKRVNSMRKGWFYEYWTLSHTRPRVTPSPHQPCCKFCKHIVKDEWWAWLLFLLYQDPFCHELEWFEKGGSVVFVAELGKKFIWFLSTETSSKGKYKTVQKSFVIRTQRSG